VQRDPARALEFYLQAAEGGAANAQFALGLLYAKGQGVPRDLALAAAWYRRAAQQGDASAQNNLGAMYACGEGVPRDDNLAAHWYRLAARQDHPPAQHNLGGLYAAGRGVAKNPVRACMWAWLARQGRGLDKAAPADVALAASTAANDFTALLSPAERRRARTLVERWLASKTSPRRLLGRTGA